MAKILFINIFKITEELTTNKIIRIKNIDFSVGTDFKIINLINR